MSAKRGGIATIVVLNIRIYFETVYLGCNGLNCIGGKKERKTNIGIFEIVFFSLNPCL